MTIGALGLVASPGTARRTQPLLGIVARTVPVLAVDRPGRDRPVADEHQIGAVLASSVAALADVPPGPPVAVWVDHADDLARVDVAAATMVVSHDPGAIDAGALGIPPDGIDVLGLPPIPPLTRTLWRRRVDVPRDLVVGVDPSADPDGDARTALALAAAAVVRGPLLVTALALATPVVTSAAEARRLGLRAGVEVEVAPDGSHADAVARELAADVDHAAALARRARQFAERHLDLAGPAGRLLRCLGLVPDAGPGRRTLEARLRELAVGPDHVVHVRHRDALALLAPAPR